MTHFYLYFMSECLIGNMVQMVQNELWLFLKVFFSFNQIIKISLSNKQQLITYKKYKVANLESNFIKDIWENSDNTSTVILTHFILESIIFI